MASFWTIVISLVIVAVVAYISSKPKVPKGLRPVPGPKGLPIIGNALDLPEYPEKKYMEWAREYGELFKIQLGWNDWVFVNSDEAVKVVSPKISMLTFRRFSTNKPPKLPLGPLFLWHKTLYLAVDESSSCHIQSNGAEFGQSFINSSLLKCPQPLNLRSFSNPSSSLTISSSIMRIKQNSSRIAEDMPQASS